MLNYHVLLEAAWLVKDVKSVNDARGVAISEAGKRLNPKLNYVDVNIGVTACPMCGGKLDSVFVAANTALVGLLFEMRVFAAESEEHASRIAKSVIGQALKDVPLKVVEVDLLEEKKTKSVQRNNTPNHGTQKVDLSEGKKTKSVQRNNYPILELKKKLKPRDYKKITAPAHSVYRGNQ